MSEFIQTGLFAEGMRPPGVALRQIFVAGTPATSRSAGGRADRARALASPAMDDESLEPSAALLERARRGEEAAGHEIVRLLHPLVSRLVRRQIRRHADVDDLVQEVFIKVFVKMYQYRGPQAFSHWVSRLAVTTCYDWLRRQKARPAIVASDLTEAELRALEHTLSHAGDDSGSENPDLLFGLLDRLIAALNPQEQIVIRLMDLEERSVAEVSELTGWGNSKVKVTAFRARKKLSALLKQIERS
jgi:RNA polymerase sigma factor (sigma-70 family)